MSDCDVDSGNVRGETLVAQGLGGDEKSDGHGY